jgi:hypothetical protein
MNMTSEYSNPKLKGLVRTKKTFFVNFVQAQKEKFPTIRNFCVSFGKHKEISTKHIREIRNFQEKYIFD